MGRSVTLFEHISKTRVVLMGAVALFFSIPSAFAADVVLHIATVDGVAFDWHEISETNSFIQQHMQDARIVTVATKVKGLGYFFPSSAAKVKADLKSKMAALHLSADDTVRMIVISAHGKTRDQKTTLNFIGEITPEGVDSDFSSLFAPILEFVSNDAKVILNSCNAMVGSDAEACGRARALLHYFGAADGFLYGSHTKEMALKGSLIPSKEILRLCSFGGLATMSALGLFLMSTEPESFRQNFLTSSLDALKFTLGVPAVVTVLMLSVGPALNDFIAWYFSARRKMNWGRVFQFKNGEVLSIEEVSKAFEKERAYGFACDKAIGDIGKP